MAKLWYIQIHNSNGAITLEQVPERWRGAVEELLAQ